MGAEFHSLEHTVAAVAARGAVVFVGLGALGSPGADAGARIRALRHATLVDPDRVEEKNVWSQHLVATDVHHPKVTVHRRRMRRINPDLPIRTWQRRVQSVPLGVLRGTAIVSAPDSRETRRFLSEAAWNVGAVLIDAGVEGSGDLLRVTVYVPGATSACAACLFDEHEYRDLEQRYPCVPVATTSAPTNARFSLALAASGHQVTELDKLLQGAHQHLLSNRQLVIDVRHHRHFVTALRRNPACRFAHDPPWSIEDLALTPRELTLARLFAEVGGVPLLRVPMTGFVTRLTCRVCGWQRALLRLANRLRPAQQRCRACGGELLAAGTDVLSTLTTAELPDGMRDRALSELGLERGDIVAVGDGAATRHVQLGRVDTAPIHSETPHV